MKLQKEVKVNSEKLVNSTRQRLNRLVTEQNNQSLAYFLLNKLDELGFKICWRVIFSSYFSGNFSSLTFDDLLFNVQSDCVLEKVKPGTVQQKKWSQPKPGASYWLMGVIKIRPRTLLVVDGIVNWRGFYFQEGLRNTGEIKMNNILLE